MEVEFSLTEADVVALVARQSTSHFNPDHAKLNWIWWIIIVVMMSVYAFGLFAGAPEDRLRIFVIFGLTAVIIVVAKWIRKALIRKAVRQLRQPENAIAFAPQKVSVTPAGFGQTIEANCSQVPWTAIARIEMFGEQAFIHTMTNTHFIIPRRAFSTEQDFMRFVATAREYHAQATLPKWSGAGSIAASEQIGTSRSQDAADNVQKPAPDHQ